MTETLQDIPLKEIFADDDFNSRGKLIPMDTIDLAKDIEKNGLIQPVVVMPCSDEEKIKSNGCTYKLLAGFRRRYAHIVLKRETIKAIVRDRMDDAHATVFNLAENLNRQDLTILQEARAIRRLSTYAYNEDQVANLIGKSRGWVQVRLMLLQLPEEVQAEVEAGFVNQAQIRELYSIYRASGTDAVYTAVKQLKDSRLLGRKNTIIDPNKTSKESVRIRTKSEMIVILEHMCDTVGVGLHTRCLAWAIGEISSGDLYESIAKYAIKEGKTYIKPV